MDRFQDRRRHELRIDPLLSVENGYPGRGLFNLIL